MKDILTGLFVIAGGIGFLLLFCVLIAKFSAYMSKLQDEQQKEHCERVLEYHLYVPAYCKNDYLSGNISE